MECRLLLGPAGGSSALQRWMWTGAIMKVEEEEDEEAAAEEEPAASPNIGSHGCYHWDVTGGNLRCRRSNWGAAMFKNSFIIDPCERPERRSERTALPCHILSVKLKSEVGLTQYTVCVNCWVSQPFII